MHHIPTADFRDAEAIAFVVVHHAGKTFRRDPAAWDILGVLDAWSNIPGAAISIVWR